MWLKFIVQGVVVGLAMAFVVVMLAPQLVGLHQLATSDSVRPGHATAISYAAGVAKAAPAVVNIHTSRVVASAPDPLMDDRFLQQFFDRRKNRAGEHVESDLGSGVLLGPAGIVVTNHHVIARADEIRVLLQDGRAAPADLVGTDPDTDLAILRIDAANLPMIVVGTADKLSVGDVVLAIGNPFGVGQTVTMGIVSAKGRSRLGINTFEDFIQTDAAINPGNSGGALITPAGQLVGINTAIVSQSGGSDGIGFAIPVDVARHVMQQILAHGFVPRGWLGIEVNPVTATTLKLYGLEAEPAGVLVSGVMPEGPGASAGLRPGDIITAVDGMVVEDPQSAVNAISGVSPGDTVKLTVNREGRQAYLSAVVSQRPS